MYAVTTLNEGDKEWSPPRVGLRATVGLGKSSAARKHSGRLLHTLIEAVKPHRLVQFVPSHILAEEAAIA